MVSSYLIRELHPDTSVVNWFFGGPRILVFWIIAAFIIYKFDSIRLKKKKETSNGLDDSKDTLFSFKVIVIGLSVAVLVIVAIKLIAGGL